ncbi:MAG: hypothetical protein C0448_03690 [Sphingobacteriaceae bacterium]|nr:hypothetical protein [Sphingobacteriaceae bacterium]
MMAQCLTTPVFIGCTPATSSPLIDGDVVNVGDIRTVNGTSNFSNITVNGGQLIICGNLTLSNLTVNSGTIFINTGGTLNCNGGSNVILNSGTNFYNNGTSIFSAHFILNANVTVINNGVLSSLFNYIIIQGLNTYLVNNNQLTSAGFMAWIPSSPACLCLGDGSATTTNYFFNKTTNSVSVPIGRACLNVRQYASNDNVVTAASELDVCVPSGISYNGLPNWGMANVINNCSGCSVVLPVELVLFDGYIIDRKAFLNWKTISETNNCSYKVERSIDGIVFNVVGHVNGAINSMSPINYQIIDNTIESNTIYYYRLKQEDCDGYYSYSNTIYLYFEESNFDVEFIKTTTIDQTIEIINDDLIQNITVLNSLGQFIFKESSAKSIDIASAADGVFYVYILTKNGKTKTYKILKNDVK